jgi:ribonuclease P/MRP protein subunit POP5
VKYFSPLTGLIILRVTRDHFRLIWGAVTLLISIEGQKIIPFVVHCSGLFNLLITNPNYRSWTDK